MAPTRLTVCAHGRCSVFMETWTSRVLEVCGKACNAEPSPNARVRADERKNQQRYRAVYDVSTNDMCCVYPVRTCAVRPTLSIVTKRLTATALCRASAINRNTRLTLSRERSTMPHAMLHGTALSAVCTAVSVTLTQRHVTYGPRARRSHCSP